MVGIVQTRDDARDLEQAACNLGNHEVGVVRLGNRGHDIAVLNAGLGKRQLVEADALHGGAVEHAAQIIECVRTLVDDADVVPVLGKHVRQTRTNTAAAYHDDVAHRILLNTCAHFLTGRIKEKACRETDTPCSCCCLVRAPAIPRCASISES